MNASAVPKSFPSLARAAASLGAILLAVSAVLFSGCQTAGTSFPAPGADWQTFAGQLHYTSATGRSLIGDVVIRRSPHGDFQLEFASGPGFPLLRLWQSGDLARAEGALVRGSWQGPANKPPRRLAGWFHLRETFARQTHPRQLAASLGGDHFAFHFGN